MYRNSNLQKFIGQWTASTIFGGTALFFVLFLSQASNLSSVTDTTSRIIGVGPFSILRVTKEVQASGTSASFEFLSGAIGYGLILIIIAIGGAWYSSRNLSTSSN